MTDQAQIAGGEFRVTTIGGLDVAYCRAGSGAPLLYLHDAFLAGKWLPFHTELARSFDVIAPDHPGFGATPRPDWLSGVTDLAIHYADVLNGLQLPAAHVVGHGLGGWLAAEFAAFYPERVRSLSLIAPSGLRPEPEDQTGRDAFRLAPEETPGILLGGDAPRFADLFAEDDPTDAMFRNYHESIAAALIGWNPRYDVKLDHRLRRLSAPTQILLPEHERLLPLTVGRRYGELIPASEVVIIEGQVEPTEHFMVLQEPIQLADRIAALARRPH